MGTQWQWKAMGAEGERRQRGVAWATDYRVLLFLALPYRRPQPSTVAHSPPQTCSLWISALSPTIPTPPHCPISLLLHCPSHCLTPAAPHCHSRLPLSAFSLGRATTHCHLSAPYPSICLVPIYRPRTVLAVKFSHHILRHAQSYPQLLTDLTLTLNASSATTNYIAAAAAATTQPLAAPPSCVDWRCLSGGSGWDSCETGAHR